MPRLTDAEIAEARQLIDTTCRIVYWKGSEICRCADLFSRALDELEGTRMALKALLDAEKDQRDRYRHEG